MAVYILIFGYVAAKFVLVPALLAAAQRLNFNHSGASQGLPLIKL